MQERLQNRVGENESTTDLESSDTGQKTDRKSWHKNCDLQPSSAISLRVMFSGL